jgi:tRNA(fMet)-specific endonuclease VapC
LATPPRQLGIWAIVPHEVETGIARSAQPEKRSSQLERLVNAAAFFRLGKPEATAAALIRSDLERLGTPIAPLDTRIAGTALANREILVTHNSPTLPHRNRRNPLSPLG